MKMCATRPLLPWQRKHKVIWPNKANSSASSRNQDTSIRDDYLFSEETTFLWGMHSCLQPSFRRRVPGQRKLKVILPIKPNASSSSRNQDTSIVMTIYFRKKPMCAFGCKCAGDSDSRWRAPLVRTVHALVDCWRGALEGS